MGLYLLSEMINGLGNLEKDLKLLLITNIPIGLSGGLFYSVWGLYFEVRGISSSYLGLYSFLEGIVMTLVFLPAGIMTDRMGRKKPVLLGYILSALSIGIVVFWGLNVISIVLSGILGGFSSLALPAFQSWLADLAESKMKEASSLQMFLYSISFSTGSLMGWIPELMVASSSEMSYPQAYRFMITLSFLAILFTIPLFLLIKERDGASSINHVGWREVAEPLKSPMVRNLTILLSISSLAMGFFYPLTSYYLGKKYGVESGPVGTVLTLIYLVSSFSYLIAPPLSKIMGTVRFIVISQGMTAALMILLPFMNNFLIASIILVLQAMGSYAPAPLIWALFMENTPVEDRGTANSLYNLSLVGPRAISSLAGGGLLDIYLEYPVSAFALLYSLYDFLFALLIKEKSESEQINSKEDEDQGSIIFDSKLSSGKN